MLQNIISFLIGVYVGQEFSQQIPNVKDKTSEFYTNYINNKKK